MKDFHCQWEKCVQVKANLRFTDYNIKKNVKTYMKKFSTPQKG